MKANLFGKKIAFYVLIIVVWQGIDSADIWPDNIFPSPIEVGEDLLYGISDGSLFYGIGTSMWRLIIGLAIAIGGGMMLGIFMARVETVNQTIGSLVLGLQSIPSVAWVPLAILWFGLTDSGIIFVTHVKFTFYTNSYMSIWVSTLRMVWVIRQLSYQTIASLLYHFPQSTCVLFIHYNLIKIN